jgi:taurine dioxygenase
MTAAARPAKAKPEIRRMTGTIGAEITGLSLTSADEVTVEMVRATVLTHRVAVVRGQFLDPEQQIAFGRKLGPFMTIRGLQPNMAWPELLRITNTGKANAAAEMWHTDGITMERPPSFSILAARLLPEAGGDTLFADMGFAYRTLSPVYRRLLRGLRVRHRAQRLAADNPRDRLHPLVRTIPQTGERVLYLGVAHIVVDIEGMTPPESRALLDFLFAHATRLEGMYRHRWQPGDVLLWDNRSTMHYAVHDYGDEPREMVRMMIEGERPFEAPYASDENDPAGFVAHSGTRARTR